MEIFCRRPPRAALDQNATKTEPILGIPALASGADAADASCHALSLCSGLHELHVASHDS